MISTLLLSLVTLSQSYHNSPINDGFTNKSAVRGEKSFQSNFMDSSPSFPYTMSITNDGPVLFDTPISIRLELVPVLANFTAASTKYYFNWIDSEGYFDCPFRIVEKSSPSPLVSIYNVTYHYLWLRCPPALKETRLIGVQVFDNPDFDWSTPLAKKTTQFRLTQTIVGNLTGRQCDFNINNQAPDQSLFLSHHAVAFSAILHDPAGILGSSNHTYSWSVSPAPAPPPADIGPGLIYTFDTPGRFEIAVDVVVDMIMPTYPGGKNVTKVIQKHGHLSKSVEVIEGVRELTLSPHNKTVKRNTLWEINVSAVATWPLTINWTLQYEGYYISHGVASKFTFEDVINETTCTLPKPWDSKGRLCVGNVVANFSQVGVYRLTIVASNRLSFEEKTVYLWAYPAKHSVDFVETVVFPLVFVVLGLAVLVLGYVHYRKRRQWMARSLEVADFEINYPSRPGDGAVAASIRQWFGLRWEGYATWVRSLMVEPNVARKPHPDAESLRRQFPNRTSVSLLDIVRNAVGGHQIFIEDGIGPSAAWRRRNSCIRLKTKEELGFDNESIDESYQNYCHSDSDGPTEDFASSGLYQQI